VEEAVLPGPFFQRLRAYYEKVAEVLRGEAAAASIFPNPTDVGMSREQVYAEFLRQHAPSKCNVFLGGFLFGEDGSESGQLDVIITTDTAPRFDFHNRDGRGKAFSPVEGTLGVASIKSGLDQRELEDSLRGIAAIPPTASLDGRVPMTVEIFNYDDWPFKIIYASSGIKGATLLQHLQTFYTLNPDIPIGRRPNIIHVSGQCVIMRVTRGMAVYDINTRKQETPTAGEFRLFTTKPDLMAIVWSLHYLQEMAAISTDIYYPYGNMINSIFDFPELNSGPVNDALSAETNAEQSPVPPRP
jgi:hypothetical protein